MMKLLSRSVFFHCFKKLQFIHLHLSMAVASGVPGDGLLRDLWVYSFRSIKSVISL